MILRSMVALCILLLGACTSASAGVVYHSDFETPVGMEWSTASRTTLVGRTFLGEFGNGNVTLTLSGLPVHDSMTLSFDLFILKSWDGNYTGYGPDRFYLDVVDGPSLLSTTFANTSSAQSFPQAYRAPGASYAARTNADEVDSLGSRSYGSSIYKFGESGTNNPAFVFAHSASSITFSFSASNLQGVSDESWGLDNVVVKTDYSVVPEPSSVLALLTGIAGFGGIAIRGRK